MKASIDSQPESKRVVGEFQDYLKSRNGPPDTDVRGKEIPPKDIATAENTRLSVTDMVR